MRPLLLCALLLPMGAAALSAQQPATPAPATPVTVAVAAKVEPPAPADQQQLLDTLSLGELQEAVNLLRANYIKPADVNEQALARATLSGLLTRLGTGAVLLPARPPANAGPKDPAPPDASRSELLAEHTGYARLGSLTKDHLADLDRALKSFAEQSVTALILDLRATPPSSDFDLAADVMRRFVPKGKPMFTLKKPGNTPERLFTSNADPAFTGLVMLLVDGDTAGAPEVIPAVIRANCQSMVVGTPTAGQAVEYADLGLSGGRVLRVAVSQVILPSSATLFPDGIKPDAPARLAREDKLAIFKQSAERGMSPFVFETERPHMSEAALVSGANPELDAARDAQAARRRGDAPAKPPLRDTVIQRALDLILTINVFAKPPDGSGK